MILEEGLFLHANDPMYDALVDENHILRQINDLVDFSFVYDELKEKYCSNNGRNARSPILLFKYLLLKSIYKLSDIDVVKRSKHDLAFKYFLGMAPLDTNLIDPSLLTVFRRQRLKDNDLLDLLVNKTVQIASDQGIIKSKAIIVDATHTNSRYNSKSPREVLIEESKKLRKELYRVDESKKDILPPKINSGIIEDHLEYCQELVTTIQEDKDLKLYPNLQEKVNYLKEIIDDNAEHLRLSYDQDAKIGHKTYDSAFFGYKTHIAMTEERIITAATVTSGEKHDGKELISLIEKSENAGMTVEEVIGDGAYSESDNLEYAKENNINLIAKLPKTVTQGNGHKGEGFYYNKDADMYMCQAGHMATRKSKTKVKVNEREYPVVTYFFDVEKCKRCPHKDGCYKTGAKSKTHSRTIKKDIHSEQKTFMNTEYFKERSKVRYMIEAKNAELKNQHGFSVANASGLFGMELQAATTIFVTNLKRIIKLRG